MIGSLATQSSCAMCSRRLVAQLATRLYPHKIMWLSTLKYVLLGQMQYTEFLAEIGKAGLSVRGFAELVGIAPKKVRGSAQKGRFGGNRQATLELDS